MKIKRAKKEVCIISKVTIDKLINYSEGLCIKRFVETLQIYIELKEINIGDILNFENASVEIIQKVKFL